MLFRFKVAYVMEKDGSSDSAAYANFSQLGDSCRIGIVRDGGTSQTKNYHGLFLNKFAIFFIIT